jgi:hypothetical protein
MASEAVRSISCAELAVRLATRIEFCSSRSAGLETLTKDLPELKSLKMEYKLQMSHWAPRSHDRTGGGGEHTFGLG